MTRMTRRTETKEAVCLNDTFYDRGRNGPNCQVVLDKTSKVIHMAPMNYTTLNFTYHSQCDISTKVTLSCYCER